MRQSLKVFEFFIHFLSHQVPALCGDATTSATSFLKFGNKCLPERRTRRNLELPQQDIRSCRQLVCVSEWLGSISFFLHKCWIVIIFLFYFVPVGRALRHTAAISKGVVPFFFGAV